MNRREVAALLAYAVKLDPRSAPTDQAAADETLEQWATLLADVPPTAPHPSGRNWDASQVVRHHIASSPYPIKPSDVSRPWYTFRSDLFRRHAGTFEPTAHPEIDPDDETGDAYVAALRSEHRSIGAGRQLPATHKAITAGEPTEEAIRRLAALGSYVPRHVDDVLDDYRPRKAARRAIVAAGQPDALAVRCDWCKASPGQPCRQGKGRRQRTTPHPSRIDTARSAA